MIYGLNLFDIDDIEGYREYVSLAGPVVKSLGGDLIAMGTMIEDPKLVMEGSTFGGAQRWLVIATFHTEEDFVKFQEHPDNIKVMHLRNEATSNYVWALYESANVMEVT